MTVNLDLEDGVIRNSLGEVMLANDVLMSEDLVNKEFPKLDISSSFWDVGFEYYFVDEIKTKVDVFLTLRHRLKLIKIIPPNKLNADYFILDDSLIPIRHHDFEKLREFLPTLDHDGILGFTVKELINFDFFASSNNYPVVNQEFRNSVFANAKIDTAQFESVLDVEPYPYQAVGIEWLRSQQSLGRRGVILGDVMGLGKTLQAIGLITHNVNSGKLDNLVICPGTLIENWRREFKKFSPKISPLIHFGLFRAGTAAKVKGSEVVITSYDALIRDHAMLSSIDWNIVIVDEAQQIKNPRAQRTIRSKGLPRNFGVAISGTPLENRLLDLWSLSEFAEPGIFPPEPEFENSYEGVPGGALEVNRILRPILLRRTLDDIEHQLPEKVVIPHPLKWPTELNDFYERVRVEAIQEFATAGGLVATGRLRKLTTHPLMMDIVSENMLELSPKYTLTVELIEDLFANNEKCLIFASYKKIIDRMTEDLRNRFPSAFIETLDGRTEMDSRTPLIDEFNAYHGPGVLVCNPIVAGAGLNITGANHVIHYNLEWNPAKEDQATFRVYRNGQLKETFIHRLFYVDTIDEVIDLRIQMKRNLSDLSLDALITKEDYLAGLQVSPGGKQND